MVASLGLLLTVACFRSALRLRLAQVEVQLDTMPFKRVHVHDVITDFAEYPQFADKVPKSGDAESTDSDTVGLDVRDSAASANQFMDGAFSTGAKTAHEFEVTAYGVAPLPPTGTWSRALGTCPYGAAADRRQNPKGQVTVLDLAAALKDGAWGGGAAGGNELRGFWSGFEATGSDGESYGVLVPFFDGKAYSGLAARVRTRGRTRARGLHARLLLRRCT